MGRRVKAIFKIFLIISLSLTISSACRCSREINKAFDDLFSEVQEALNLQISAIDSIRDKRKKRLIFQIDKNIYDIKEQNKVLEKLIEGEKRKVLQNTEIIFILKQIIELKNTGEMR